MKAKISNWLAAFTLFEWGGIFVYFYSSGRIAAFLHPSFQLWVLLCGLFMMAAGGVIFYSGVENCDHGHDATDCCGHDHSAPGFESGSFSSWIRILILLLPMAGAAVFSPDRYGEVFLQNRKTITTAVEMPGSFKPNPSSPPKTVVVAIPPVEPVKPAPETKPVKTAEKAVAAKEVDLMDLVYSSGVESEREEMEGQTLSLTGQLVRDQFKGLRVGDFGVYRLIIVCCAADARPVSIRIIYPDLKPDLKNTDWIRVTGKIHFMPSGAGAVPILTATEVVPIAVQEEASFNP